MDKIFGPPNVSAISGNGGMVADFSPKGELTVFHWPCPSHYDQMRYMTFSRDEPRFGAKENRGSFAGLLIRTDDGSWTVTWLRDEPWMSSQTHLTEKSAVVVTSFINESVGLSVELMDFVLPDADILVRMHRVATQAGSRVTDALLVYYENFAPCSEKIPYLPIRDWLMDYFNDFGLVYDLDRDALLHFRPYQGDENAWAGRVEQWAGSRANGVHGASALLDELYPGGGVFLAVGADRTLVSHQCGSEDLGEGLFADAYFDIADGQLTGTPACAGRCTGSLLVPLDLSDGEDAASVFIAAGFSAGEAVDLLEWGRGETADSLLEYTELWWDEWISRARMPHTEDHRLLDVSRRMLISVKQCQDRNTGAIIAAPTTQPPYSEDWPRDGSFIKLALDRAGYLDEAEAHMRFYASVQRPITGTFEMNYYCDGVPGGVIPFEIDETAIPVWALWEHAGFIEDPEQRRRYLAWAYPAIRKGAQFLADWEDPFTGLQLPAWESDFPNLQRTLRGAASVYLALRCALEAGESVGEDPALLDQWRERQQRLVNGIYSHLFDPGTGTFNGDEFSKADLIWPAAMLPEGDALTESTAQEVIDAILTRLRGGTDAGSYEGLGLLALARIWKDRPDRQPLIEEALHVMVHSIPIPQTLHYGEIWVRVDRDGDGVAEFENHAGIPHLETPALIFSTAVELYGASVPTDDPPDSEQEDDGGGCGCAL